MGFLLILDQTLLNIAQFITLTLPNSIFKQVHILLDTSILRLDNRQWGYQSLRQNNTAVTAPIACNFLQGIACDIGNTGSVPAKAVAIAFEGTQTIYLRTNTTDANSVGVHYFIIGAAL